LKCPPFLKSDTAAFQPELLCRLKSVFETTRVAVSTEGNPSPLVLFQMATGYWLSQAIYVAAKLGIADFLERDKTPLPSMKQQS
jgi:hypothetical protein